MEPHSAAETLLASAHRLQTAFFEHRKDLEPVLGRDFAARFSRLLDALSTAHASECLAALTDEQKAAFRAMKRLAAEARRTAALAFADDSAELGALVSGAPLGIDAWILHATEMHAMAARHHGRLAARGWMATDTVFLGELIALLDGPAPHGNRLAAAQKSMDPAAADSLLGGCTAIQEAARRVFLHRLDATLRARFLLDEFPSAPPRPAGAK